MVWATRRKIYWGVSCCQHADVNNTNIDIYIVSTMPSTMLITPINVPLVSLKVLIQNEQTQWFTYGTLRSVFVQGIVRVGYSPSLLLLWTLVNTFHINILCFTCWVIFTNFTTSFTPSLTKIFCQMTCSSTLVIFVLPFPY